MASKSRTGKLAGALAVLALAAGAPADMYLAQRIDLDAFFGPLGNNPMTVASDGTYAYIGGYSASATDIEIGILKINLSDPTDAVTLAGGTQTVKQFRFYDGLVVRGGVLYALCDRPLNLTASTNVRAIDVTTGALVETFDGDDGLGNGIVLEPCGLTVGATGGLAVDPGVGGPDFALSLLGYGAGKRPCLELATGLTIYDTGDGMVVADTSGTCAVSDASAWRDHVYDAAGNVYTRRSNQVQVSLRAGPNAIGGYLHLTDELNADGSPKAGCGDGQPLALRLAPFVIGQHLELIPASSAATDQDLILFNNRPNNDPGQTFAGAVLALTTTGALPSPAFQLLKGDGSPLTEAEVPAGNGLYDFCYLPDSDGLLVLDFSARKLLVFSPTPQAQPCPGDFNCDGQINFDDIDPFVTSLVSQTCCDPSGANCDVNGDGNIDFGDIDPFVVLLSTGAQCP